MIIYVARCRTPEETKAVQDALIAACPTLIHSRLLTKPQDLDVYNAELLKSQDEQLAVGDFAFGRNDNIAEHAWRGLCRQMTLRMILAIVLLAAALLLGLRAFRGEAPSERVLAALWICLAGGLGLLLFLGVKAAQRISVDHRAFRNARRWLKSGRPVVIAASEDSPDEKTRLPDNVISFEARPRQPAPKAA